MQIFLCYANEHKDKAEPLAFALRERGHDVFLDRDDLPAGRGYHEQIETAIKTSDLMIYLITKESVTPGRFTLSEVEFARQHFRRPGRRILPVLVEPVIPKLIPAFAQAVTFVEPKGNLTAEVVAAVDRLRGTEYVLSVAFQMALLGLAAGLLSYFAYDPDGTAIRDIRNIPYLGRIPAPEVGFLFGFPIAFGAWYWGLRRWWAFAIPMIVIAFCYWVSAPFISEYTRKLGPDAQFMRDSEQLKTIAGQCSVHLPDEANRTRLVQSVEELGASDLKYRRSIVGLNIGLGLALGTMLSLAVILPAFRSIFRWLVVVAAGAVVSAGVTNFVLAGSHTFSNWTAVWLMTPWLLIFSGLIGYWLARGRTSIAG